MFANHRVPILCIAAVSLVMCSCNPSFYVKNFRRGQPIPVAFVESLENGVSQKSKIIAKLGEAYYAGTIGERELLGYIDFNVTLSAYEHPIDYMVTYQPQTYPNFTNWTDYTTGEIGESVAISEVKVVMDAELWLEFEDDILVDYRFYYTPPK